MRKIRWLWLVLVVISAFLSSCDIDGDPTLIFVSSGDGTCSVGIGSYKSKNIIIPETSPSGDVVTSIYADAFKDCSALQSISIPDTVIYVADNAFSGCADLIQTENGFSYVDKWVIACDATVTDLSFRADTVGIAANVFKGREDLTSIVIPEGVKSISNYAFSNCINLTDVALPDSLLHIGDGAFMFCSSLEEITIPQKVNCIDDNVFAGCSSLSNIYLPNNLSVIGSHAFHECINLTSITLPSGVTEIGDNAFYNCTGLENITIPDGIESIGYSSFSGCVNIETVTLPASAGIFIPKDNLKTVIITSGIEIETWAFAESTRLTSVTLPDSATTIGESAFRNCTSLENIAIPDSVTYIGAWAFSDCTQLTSIVLPDSGVTVDTGAFYGCVNVTNIVIPDSAVKLWDIFDSVENVASVTMPATMIDSYVWYEGLPKLETLIITSGSTIPDGAFSNCPNLTNVSIADSITDIGDRAFHSSNNIKTARLPSIACKILKYSYDLESLIITSGSSIDKGNFENCKKLTFVIIPQSVTSIGWNVFLHCRNLETIFYGGTKDDWDKISIDLPERFDSPLKDATRYYYCESEPDERGNYWRYVDGEPTPW